MLFKVQIERVEEFVGKRGAQKSRRLLLLGAESDLTEQLCEFNMPAEHEEIGVGKVVRIDVREVASIYSGKPRLLGHYVGPVSVAGPAPLQSGSRK